MNHLLNALDRLRNSATTATQQLIIGEVSAEARRIALAYALVDRKLKDAQGKAMGGYDRNKYTPEQWEWCIKYQRETGFDPMMEDFEAGNKTFVEAAQFACTWYEDHSSDAHLRITRGIPGELT